MSKLKEEKKRGGDSAFSLFSLAWDLGWMISVPIVIFGIGGAVLDRKFGTSPWILLIGMAFSIFLTSFFVYSKVTKIIADLSKKNPKEDIKSE